MLILTRRIGESLMVGDEVEIIVLGVKGNQVRMGINAPKTIPVHRKEIFNRIKDEENPEATETAIDTKDEPDDNSGNK